MTEQPKRAEGDGRINVAREGEDRLVISAVQDGVFTEMTCSEYNAWRILGCLSLVLDVKLAKGVDIDLGNKDMTMAFTSTAKSFGERVAADLAMQALAEATGGKLTRVKKAKR